jgi:hypothetical protein
VRTATAVRKPEGKTPLRIPRHRLGDNIKMTLGDIGQESVNSNLVQDRNQWHTLVNMVVKLQVP